MKIALIRYHDTGEINTRLPLSLDKIRGVLPPLGLAYIAAYLERIGHNIKIIDAMVDNLSKKQVYNILREFSPVLVGITAMTPAIEGVLEAAKIAKDCNAKVVIGGPHISAYPQETLSYEFVDFGINGDGEIPFAELIEAIEGKRQYADIKGLIYKNNGIVINNGPYVLMDLDILPFPAYHLLPEVHKYSSIISARPMSTMVTARGCPYNCGFCFSQPADKFYRTINPVKVVDQMEMLLDKYKLKEIMFYDDTIGVNRKHIESICLEIINRKLKVKWESPCRVDNVDFNLLNLMSKAGCFRLRFGVESGNEQILRLMNKKISLKQVEQVFKWCRQVNISTFAYFIIGYATENSNTIKDTIDFAKRINPDFVMFTVATAYPHTHLYKLALDNKIIEGDYWKEFTLGKRKDRMPYFIENSEYWLKKVYREFYFRPLFILRRILKINSLESLKNMLLAAKGLLFFKISSDS